MKKKTLIMSVIMLFAVLSLALPAVYANHGGGNGGGKSCPMMSAGKCGAGGGYQKGGGLDKMFFMKSHFILENREELGLTDDNVKAIESLKTDTLKSLIRQNADIAVVCIDIKTALHQYPIDTAAVNKLVDQKYDLKKAKTKTLVDAIAKLKGTLTKEQYDKLKEIWQGKEKGGEHKGH